MPDCIRGPYIRYISQVRVFNTISGAIGVDYSKLIGIPQGDPFSMMATALLMRAWIMQMRSLGVKPRILVDDLLFLATDQEEAKTNTLDANLGESTPLRAKFVGGNNAGTVLHS